MAKYNKAKADGINYGINWDGRIKGYNNILTPRVILDPVTGKQMFDFVGISPKNVSIQSQSIYIPNHPFKDNQKVTLTKPSTANVIQVRATSDGPTFNLPASGNSQDVYIINKSKDFIGLTTASGITSTTNGFFFVNAGSDNDEYNLRTNHTQLTADVKRVKAKVAVSTSHNLIDNDNIGITIMMLILTIAMIMIMMSAEQQFVPAKPYHSGFLIVPRGPCRQRPCGAPL